MLISILICTRKRPEKLRHTLESIAQLEIPAGTDFEVLILDNGLGNDGTKEVCSAVEPLLPQRLQYLHLTIPGKSRSANAGFQKSKGDLIAFLDDDVLPEKDWLSVMVQAFSSDHDLGAISGRVALYNNLDLPTGIRLQTERVVYQQAIDSYDLFIGCNFAVRREVLEKFGLYDPDIGPGLRIGSGEDTDFCYRIWKAGIKVVYEPALFILHDHGRRSLSDQGSILRTYSLARGAVYAKHIWQRDKKLASSMYWEIRSQVIDSLSRKQQSTFRNIYWLMAGFTRYSFIRALRYLGAARLAESLARN